MGNTPVRNSSSSSSTSARVLPRGCCRTSLGALIEVLQHGGVGFLKQPLLSGRGRVTRVHEDTPLVRAAVDTAVADGVVQTLILEGETREMTGCVKEKLFGSSFETRTVFETVTP